MDVMMELNRMVIFYDVFGRTGDYLKSAKESLYYPPMDELEEKGIVNMVTMDFRDGTPPDEGYRAMTYVEAQKFFTVYTDKQKVTFNSVIFYDDNDMMYYVHEDVIREYIREEQYRKYEES